MNPLHQLLFHIACTFRRPAHWRWHLAGIRRALACVTTPLPACA